jgi:putative phosphoribosyl transferase
MPILSSLPNRVEVLIDTGPAKLRGILDMPDEAGGLVLFVHGSGSSRHSSRNQRVAGNFARKGLATLLFDLLTEEEERQDARSFHLRFAIRFLADRLHLATAWVRTNPVLAELPLGYFGASTGAAAALIAAAEAKSNVRAVVSRGGRPDLAGPALSQIATPTLLIVGGDDTEVLALNQAAFSQLRGEKRLEVIPGASHLFEEPGALDAAAELACWWFWDHLATKGWAL